VARHRPAPVPSRRRAAAIVVLSDGYAGMTAGIGLVEQVARLARDQLD
jgi:hypothetical protein